MWVIKQDNSYHKDNTGGGLNKKIYNYQKNNTGGGLNKIRATPPQKKT